MKKKIHIIGGGLGGLSAAISLATQKDVEITLHEKNEHFGGKLNVLSKDGFNFDLGPSIFTMPQLFEPLFTMHHKKMSDYLSLTRVRPHWRNIFEDGTVLDLHETLEKTVNQSKILKQDDLDDLNSYYAYAEKLYQFSHDTMFVNQSERKRDTLKYYNPFKIVKDSDMFHTMDEGVRRHINNPYLIDTLNFFIKYVGGSPYEAPAMMNLLPYIQWKFDLWYVKGGMFALSEGLQKLAKELNITLKTNSEITSIKKDNHEITHIEVNNKELFEADFVVSNMETFPFYEKISKESEESLSLLKKKYPPASSGFALHLGVNKTYDLLKHHNIFHAHSSKQHFDSLMHERTLSDDPTIYVVAPMKTDPSQGQKDMEIIKILPHIPPLDHDKPYTQEEYEVFKDNILRKLERMGLTDLRKHIITEELWTPHTLEKTYYSHLGSIYGTLSHKRKNMGFKHPKQSPFYNNLYFVGGTTNPGGGMPMVVLSGQQTAQRIKELL